MQWFLSYNFKKNITELPPYYNIPSRLQYKQSNKHKWGNPVYMAWINVYIGICSHRQWPNITWGITYSKLIGHLQFLMYRSQAVTDLATCFISKQNILSDSTTDKLHHKKVAKYKMLSRPGLFNLGTISHIFSWAL